MTPTHHVVLVTYGEPETPAFAEHLAYSWRILLGLTRTIAPIPKVLLPMIAVARARGRHATWKAEGYTSPLEPLTRRQAQRLEGALRALAPTRRWQVHVAYEFRSPLIGEVLSSLPADEPVSVAPMYATASAFTHGLSHAVVAAEARTRAATGRRALPAIDVDVLAEASAMHIRAHLEHRAGWMGDEVALVLAAHGTLVNPSRPIDTGLAATERLCRGIRDRLSDSFGYIVNAWLNHTRGGTWTSPAVDDALRGVVEQGFTKVVYFPYGFLADNAESELEGRVALRGEPSLSAVHLPCLNDSPLLIAALAAQVTERAAGAVPVTRSAVPTWRSA